MSADAFLNETFPFHIRLSASGGVRSFGPAWPRLGYDFRRGDLLEEHFTLEAPLAGPATAATLTALRGQLLILETRSGLRLKGGSSVLEGSLVLTILPVIENLAHLAELGLTLLEFPPHDVSGEFLLLLHTLEVGRRDMKASLEHLHEKKTELDRAAADLRASQNALAQREGIQDLYYASFNHELRAPAQAILGYSEMLERTAGISDPSLVTGLSGTAKHLSALLDGLAESSQMDRGLFTLALETFDVGQLIDEANKLASTFSTRVDVRLPASLTRPVQASLKHVRSVLFNLVSNGCKYGQEGDLLIEVSVLRETGADCTIRIEVTDHGIGVPEAERQNIFEQGYRGSNAQYVHGHGFGLHISRSLAEAMQGSLWHEAPPDGGSRFVFEFPAVIVRDLPVASSGSSLPRYRHSLNILCVEDYPPAQVVIRHALSAIGKDIDVASSCSAAETLVGSTRYDLVLLDMNLPDGHGLDLLRKVNDIAHAHGERPPVAVALTGQNDATIRGRCTDTGFSEFLLKPVTFMRLQEVVGRLCPDLPKILVWSADYATLVPHIPSGCRITVTSEKVPFFRELERGKPWDAILLDPADEDGARYSRTRMTLVPPEGVPLFIVRVHPDSIGLIPDPRLTLLSKVEDVREALLRLTQGPERPALSSRPSVDISDLSEKFIERLRSDVSVLHEAIKQSDFEAVRSVSHNIKGTAAMVGFPQLEDPARVLEQLIQCGGSEARVKQAFGRLAAKARLVIASSTAIQTS